MPRKFLTSLVNIRGFFKAGKKLYSDINNFMSGATAEESRYILQNTQELRKQISQPIKFTFLVIAFAIGFFVIWGSLAPLDSATIAPGFVVLSGNHKTIQHLEGGVINKIMVKDGELVKENQQLISLNDTSARARLQMILSQLRASKAVELRLLAEKYGDPSINYDDEIFDTSVLEVQKIIKTQNALFETRVKSIRGKLDILAQKVVQHKEQIKGLEAVYRSLEAQDLIIKEQLASLQNLFDKGYAKKTDLLELKKRAQEVEGRVGEIKANIAGSNETIAETQLQIMNLENDNQNDINDHLKEAEAQILDLQEQYQAAKDVVERTVIRAPAAGIVTGLQYHTTGGVISPGSKLMDIVPQDDELIVEAHVMPKDIESIRIGLLAKVQLSAYKSRLVPRVSGEVIYVSADKFNDDRNNTSYYIAKVKIEQKELDAINYDVKLYPGMPADVFIVKGERTFLQYLVSPITDSFHRAFKEK